MKRPSKYDIQIPSDRADSAAIFDNSIDDLLTADELACRLKVKICTVRNWRYTRAIPEDCMVVIGQKLVRYKWRRIVNSPFLKG